MVGSVDLFPRRQLQSSLKGIQAVPAAAAAAPGILKPHGQFKGLIQAGGIPGAGGQHLQGHVQHTRSVVQAQGALAIKGLIQRGGIPDIRPERGLREASQQWW
jgi:hypothetical protein